MPADFDQPEFITVLRIDEGVALVRLPDASEEPWSLASLPEDVREGDTVAVRVEAGDMDCWIVPRAQGVRA